MTVYVTYQRGYPWNMRVFRSRTIARRYVNQQVFPRNWVVHQRQVT